METPATSYAPLPDPQQGFVGEIQRADESTRAIPVFALSANAMRSDVEQGLAAGFDGYLTKPVNIP
jgi:CheY-like chemotaxis protein